jgi:pilus assembly protein Flp/PilA
MKRLFHNQEGATAIEYALIAALVVLACVAAFTSFGDSSNGMWGKINNEVSSKL